MIQMVPETLSFCSILYLLTETASLTPSGAARTCNQASKLQTSLDIKSLTGILSVPYLLGTSHGISSWHMTFGHTFET